jgi:hypothetical protein
MEGYNRLWRVGKAAPPEYISMQQSSAALASG